MFCEKYVFIFFIQLVFYYAWRNNDTLISFLVVDATSKTSSTVSPIFESSPHLTKSYKILLVTKCTFVSLFALSVFVAGLLVRIHVPLPGRSPTLEVNISTAATNVTTVLESVL